MDEKIALRGLGLTENEATVYLYILEYGSATISEIADKISIHRVNLYDLLKRLVEKGLVSYSIQGRSKIYIATDPSYLMKLLKEKESYLQQVLPQLELKKELSKPKNTVKVFQGRSGIKAIFEDMLKDKRTIHVYGAEGNFLSTMPIYFKQFHKRRVKEKIKIRIVRSEKVRRMRHKHPFSFSDVRFISKIYDSPSSTFIYGSKVAIIIWISTLIGILIESHEVSLSYNNFFKLLWDISKI